MVNETKVQEPTPLNNDPSTDKHRQNTQYAQLTPQPLN